METNAIAKASRDHLPAYSANRYAVSRAKSSRRCGVAAPAGRVPVIQSRVGLNVSFQQTLDQPLVEIDAVLVVCASACGLNARPADGKAIRRHAEIGDRDPGRARVDDSDRTLRRRCRHPRSRRARGRTHPKSTAPCRRRAPRLRSETRWWPRPRQNRSQNADAARLPVIARVIGSNFDSLGRAPRSTHARMSWTCGKEIFWLLTLQHLKHGRARASRPARESIGAPR